MSLEPAFDRIVACEGIVNFRDYGGYAVRGGGRVRTGALYRSAQHFAATERDLERVAALKFDVVFDLRGVSERVRAPCVRPLGFAAEVIMSEGDTAGSLAPHFIAGEGATDAAAALRGMEKVYRGMLARPVLQDVLRRYFERLARGPCVSLVHCHAGKDRTGIAVALLHRILGVHEDDIFADYILTNAAAQIEERFKATDMRSRYPSLTDDAVKLLLGVHPHLFSVAFDEMTKLSGSVDAYLENVLGVDRERADRLRDLLIV